MCFIVSLSAVSGTLDVLFTILMCMKPCQVIRNHPRALDIYENQLLALGQISKEDIEKIHDKVNTILNEEFANSKDYVPRRRDWLSAYWAGFKSPEQLSRIRNTGYVVVARFCVFTYPYFLNFFIKSFHSIG